MMLRKLLWRWKRRMLQRTKSWMLSISIVVMLVITVLLAIELGAASFADRKVMWWTSAQSGRKVRLLLNSMGVLARSGLLSYRC
jgi:uncharacterized membrane protein